MSAKSADITAAEEALLHRALDLAAQGSATSAPNPRVGCVLHKDGAVCGEGWHRSAGTAHAEILALAEAGESAAGSTAYLSLEPCNRHGRTPPCTEALIAAGVARVVAAMPDPNPQVDGGGFAALRAAGIPVTVAAAGSAVRRRAQQLNLGFASRMRRQRPWVCLKIAATLDGKTALGSGLSRWISGEEARKDAHHLRACAGAVVTGIGTALQDDPQLTVRHVPAVRQPLRVLVDSKRRGSTDMRLFADGNILVVAALPPPPDFAAQTLTLPTADGKVDLPAMLRALGERGINDALVEAGRQLNGALLADGLVDEIVLYLAGRVFGEGGKDMFKLPAAATPAAPDAAPAFHRHAIHGYGNGDIKITYQNAQALEECYPTTAA